MEDTVIVLMEKNNKTGFLEKEICSFKIDTNENLLINTFLENKDGERLVYLKLTTDRDVDDWEYGAIFDYYDTDIFNGIVLKVNELEDLYNPAWEFIFIYKDDVLFLEETVNKILIMHKNELDEVYKAINENKKDYE